MNFGLGQNDNLNMMNNMFIMLQNMRNGLMTSQNVIVNNPDTGSNTIIQNNNTNLNNFFSMVSTSNNYNNFLPFHFHPNINFDFSPLESLDRKNINRNESLDVKSDIDKILWNNKSINSENKNIEKILNYIPFTEIQDPPKNSTDNPHCVICLNDFQLKEKVSALPCCHSFHTKCLDNWITRSAKCPVCKFEVTLKNLIGEDFIKEMEDKIKKTKENKCKKHIECKRSKLNK